MISQPKSRKSLIFLTILLLPVKIRKPVFISVKHLSVLGAPGGCNHSVPSSSCSWPPLRFSFVTMITWFSYQINYIITCSKSDVDVFLTIFIVLAEYNPQRNSIDVYTSAGYMLRIDC